MIKIIKAIGDCFTIISCRCCWGIVHLFISISADEVIKEKIVKEEFTSIEIKSENAEVDVIPTDESVAKIELLQME